MATQKRRVIYMTDEEWALLAADAKEKGTTISNTIREMWRTASIVDPAPPAMADRIRATATERLGHDPYHEVRPVPKPGRK